MSCYVSYRHVLLFSFTHCWWHSVASVFHCEDLFVHWSSGISVTCWSHPISMVLTIQATVLVAFSRVLTVWGTQFFMVLTVQATMLLAFSQVLTVWATLLSMVLLFKPPLFLVLSWVLTVWATLVSMVLTVQATIIFSSVKGVKSHPVSSMVLTVQATIIVGSF